MTLVRHSDDSASNCSFGFPGGAIRIAEAHRGDGKHYVVRADEKLTAFLELKSAICT